MEDVGVVVYLTVRADLLVPKDALEGVLETLIVGVNSQDGRIAVEDEQIVEAEVMEVKE